MNLNGKVALVTGASGGLGQRICNALVNEGTSIAVIYNSSKNLSEKIVSTIKAQGVEAAPFQCDVSDHIQVEAMVEAVMRRFGHIDILINDAAYNKWIPFN